MKLTIKTTTGAKITVYNIHCIQKYDDRIILSGRPVAFIGNEAERDLMLIGLEDLPGRPIATDKLVIWKNAISKMEVN